MGSAQLEGIAGIDLTASPVYCLGLAEDIVNASESESTNTILKRLKECEGQRVFKYRIRNHSLLQYFSQYYPTILVVKPWKKDQMMLGIINISSKYALKVHSIMAILRKELAIEEKESIFLYMDGKLCQPHQSISGGKSGEVARRELYFSKMQISG